MKTLRALLPLLLVIAVGALLCWFVITLASAPP